MHIKSSIMPANAAHGAIRFLIRINTRNDGNAHANTTWGKLMTEADDAFEHARRAFRNASEAATLQAMRDFVIMGLTCLDRAERLSAVLDNSQGTDRAIRPR